MTREQKNRRKHERVEVAQAIYIEIVSYGSRSESQNTIIRCETVNVSVGGLKIHVAQEIPRGSKLNIAVPMEGWKENLELTGEAVWVRPVEGGSGYWVGLELQDTNRDNMEKWFRAVHSMADAPL